MTKLSLAREVAALEQRVAMLRHSESALRDGVSEKVSVLRTLDREYAEKATLRDSNEGVIQSLSNQLIDMRGRLREAERREHGPMRVFHIHGQTATVTFLDEIKTLPSPGTSMLPRGGWFESERDARHWGKFLFARYGSGVPYRLIIARMATRRTRRGVLSTREQVRRSVQRLVR